MTSICVPRYSYNPPILTYHTHVIQQHIEILLAMNYVKNNDIAHIMIVIFSSMEVLYVLNK